MALRLCLAALVILAADAGKLRKGQPKTTIQAENFAEVESDVVVRKPLTDKRSYTYKKFESGLRVLLVQNPEAQKSSYAVAVEVGSMDDPEDFQGLAHFCEHMVFLGSKKYPQEDQFSSELALHGGTNNAYTSSDQTVYYAEVGNEGFEKTFDIFAQFFIEPTFASNMVDKEINAVDSEHKKNMPDTSRRLWHLLRSKANPKSPLSKFSTGNLKTLKEVPEKNGKSLEQALHAFHEKHYCPSRMHLVIMSNQTAEQQLEIAHKSFDALEKQAKKSCEPRPIYEGIPSYSEELGNIRRSITVGTPGTPQLELMFPVVSLRTHYKEQAEVYVNYALNHYGPGGLKALLKKEDLSMHYSAYFETTPAGTNFFVTFQLTEKGAKQREKVMEYFFAYFNNLRRDGVDEDIIKRVKAMNKVSFDYQEQSSSESDIVTNLAGSLPSVEPEDVLAGGVLIDEIDTELSQKILNALKPDNMNVVFVDPDFDEVKANKHEKYYDFNYTEVELDGKLVERLNSSSGFGLKKPPSLQYVPSKLDLITEHTKKEDMPDQVSGLGSATALWWLGLGRFKLPKTQIQMKLAYPRSIVKSAARKVLAGMHSRLVNLALEEPSDALQMCGMSYGFSSGSDGMSISFSGFDEHILELVKLVLPVVRTPGNVEANFEMVRRQMVLDFKDITRQQPYQHAMETFDLVTIKGSHSRAAMLAAVKDSKAVSPEAHEAFLQDVFQKPKLTLLVTGNMDKARAAKIAEFGQEALATQTDSPSEKQTGVMEGILDKARDLLGMAQPQKKPESANPDEEDYPVVLKPDKELEIRVSNPIPQDPNSATIAAYQFGIPTLADRVRFSMISGIIDRPVFEVLRTEHQLGYVVFGYVTAHRDVLEIRVLVQGFRKDPDQVGLLIEDTVQNLTSKFASLSESEFNVRKASLRRDLSKPPSNLGEYAGKFWGQIWDETYCFDKAEREVQFMDSKDFQKPSDLLDAWKHTVGSGSARKKLTVKLFGADSATGKVSIPNASASEDIQVLTDVESVSESAFGNHWPHEFLCK
eukprot:TRINITY_DN24053_c0_g1_i1.p1 TRINITY_DN24053_c0_g1~~TRINITY_DN24053_c0_g1_i1.p1  ORF type:complete len:1037 (+),score=233.28 TRINITY_DN24053_c0_g1_i1:89-3199(+)